MNGAVDNNVSETIKKSRTFYIIEGILFILLGAFALVAPYVFTISFEILFGCLLLIGGFVQLFRTFQQGVHASGFWLSLFTSILSIFCGIYLLAKPLHGIIALTLLLAFLFLMDGGSKIYLWFAAKGAHNRSLFLLSGILSLIIGCIIYFGLPASSLWAIGTLIGVNLLFTGIFLLGIVFSIPKGETNQR